MEVLFENKYTRDKEWAKDIYGYIYFRRPMMIVLSIIFLLYLLIGIYNLMIACAVDWFYIFFPVAWYAYIAFSYRRIARTVINRDLEMHGKAIEVTVTVSEDVIKQTQSTGSEFQLNYGGIKRAVQTKKYVYLWSKTNMLYSLKKESFSLGSTDDFIFFLKNKGIKVK